jgi:hypothetical protein
MGQKKATATEISKNKKPESKTKLGGTMKLGQKKPTPEEGCGLRKYYTSLLKQNKNSSMALKWCLEHGLLSTKKAQEAVITLGVKGLKIE